MALPTLGGARRCGGLAHAGAAWFVCAMLVSPLSAPLNPLVADTGSPPIPEAQGWLKRYDGARGPAIDLSQAVPGYPPHADLLSRLAASAGDPAFARYGAIVGDADLKSAYAAHVSQFYGAGIAPAEIAITAGCNLAFVVAAMLVAKAGDAILLPTPWYFNHQMVLDMLGVEPRALPCRPASGFVPDVAEAARLIDARTRAIVLVSPNNPTGAIYPAAVIEDFARLCRERGLWLIVDETYRDFLPDPVAPTHGLFAGEWRKTLIGLYSFSKGYCIPGHRAGAMIAGPEVIREIEKILDCLQICAPRVGQAALAWAIPALGAWRERNRREIESRAAAFSAAITASPGWAIKSIGAYFAYLRHPFADTHAAAVAERLAAERGVLALPGSYFGPGQEGHLRFAFANVGSDVIARLPDRLAGFAMR